MATGNRIILPEHIARAENEPDPRAAINAVQGPLNGWLMNRVAAFSEWFPPSEEDQPARVKDEIVLAYNAIRYAYDGTLPRVESTTVAEYFETLMKHPEDDPLEAPADRDKLEAVKSGFSAEQVHLDKHMKRQLGEGVLYVCGLTCVSMSLEMLLRQRAKDAANPSSG